MNVPEHLVNAFTPEQLREHRELFTSFDKDGGGTIDAEEMTELAKTLGLNLSVEGARNLIEEIDLDGDGLVDFVEFLTLMVDLQRYVSFLCLLVVLCVFFFPSDNLAYHTRHKKMHTMLCVGSVCCCLLLFPL